LFLDFLHLRGRRLAFSSQQGHQIPRPDQPFGFARSVRGAAQACRYPCAATTPAICWRIQRGKWLALFRIMP